MTSFVFPYYESYKSEHSVTVTLNEDGSVEVYPVGYYEDSVIIPAEALRMLGLTITVPCPSPVFCGCPGHLHLPVCHWWGAQIAAAPRST